MFQEHCNINNDKNNNESSGDLVSNNNATECAENRSNKPCKVSQPIGIVPKIVTEEFECDTSKVSTSNESEESSWKSDKESRDNSRRNSSDCDSNSIENSGGGIKQLSKSVGSVRFAASQHRRSPSESSTGSMADTHPSHYHTVHGTTSISQNHYYERAASPLYSTTPSKQRTRSHSGPTYPLGFTQQIRHSALISAGISPAAAASTTGAPNAARHVYRRQSDDSESASTSLRSRVSPSSSFFDNFRYVLLYVPGYKHWLAVSVT